MDTTVETSEWRQTACALCYINCGIEVRLGGEDGRRFERIRGDKAHPASQGYTCQKALRLDHYQNGRHRLTSPMRRRPDGTYEEIDWDTAIAEVAAGLQGVIDRHGGETILYYGGGGQGNHLGGSYGFTMYPALGSKYRSNALAQEKGGEFFVDDEVYGGHSSGDFENAEVVMFVGKNAWQSHGFHRARTILKAINNDPDRTMIVIDPVRNDTAALADHYLAVRPGTDAFLLAAMLAVLVEEDLLDHTFLAEHTTGAEEFLSELKRVPIPDYCARAGIPEEQVRTIMRRIASASSVSTFEELGIEQSPHSTLNSFLHKTLWALIGSFGKPGGMGVHSWMLDLTRTFVGRPDAQFSPVTGARVMSGLVPCNVIPDEILTDHPKRFRAMVVESSNPAHSLADSVRMREAIRSLEFSVVIDVAFTETAAQADYVLPAASQYEKWECTYFNLSFPKNTFHLRAPLLDPLPGTLSEPEIHYRIARAMGHLTDEELAPLREALESGGRLGLAAAYISKYGVGATIDELGFGPLALYAVLGPTLPDGAAAAAVLWALCHRVAMMNADAVRRAGIEGEGPMLGEALFEAILNGRSGVTFTVDDYDETWKYVEKPDHRINLNVPEMLEELAALRDEPPATENPEFPFVLTCGSRRGFSANTIIRDPDWRKVDRGGALHMSPADAEHLGITDGSQVIVTTKRGRAETTVEVTDAMQPGHIILPNGYGLSFPDEDGRPVVVGVPPNSLTSSEDRDRFAGTPWHKHVRARVEAVSS
ncbi:MAG TPA: molybdopterin-dependent oxidoreductase [Actinomycetota bacterium]|nr:molybdopterin-dependent oxidoreductase [Actinomycetota bacterium]